MEISKALQEEILSVQNKLKNAIRDHQICVEKLKDDPDNTNILDQIQQIQIYIVSLGRRQKQVIQRLRKEVETLKAENANGSKVSVASLLGLNNNNHIINNNEAKRKTTDAKNLKDINGLDTRLKKEDYEDEIRNAEDSSPAQENDCSNRERSNSVETISYEDEVVEVSPDENSSEKQDMEEECGAESLMQLSFLGSLGLITTTKCMELQNRKAERKRRSTANPQFVYSNWELPTKRRRYSYLQSAGNAPQTRQSTARSNGPSPPPGKILTNKSIPPSTKNSAKSLILTQKSTSKPNILRNASENKAFNKSGTENGQSQSVKSAGSKVVHIPGLPSSLTIERIESDSAVCINCRNPGTLTVCQQCSSKYHVSCHSISPPPSRICPKCALNTKDSGSLVGISCKKENELAAAAHAAGLFGKAGENSEVHKASRGFHKIDSTSKRNLVPYSFGFNQLPSSTFLIPISNSIPTHDQSVTNTSTSVTRSEPSEITIIDQHSQSGSISYIQSESQLPNSSYQMPNSSYQLPVGRDKNQSYLIVKKVPDSTNFGGRSDSRQNTSVFNRQTETQSMPLLNYQLSSPCGYSTTHGEPEMPLSQPPRISNKFTSRHPESNAFGGKKPNNRSLPGLNRIFFSDNSLHGFTDSSSDEDVFIAKKNVPRSGGLLHSLFSGNNKSDIIASGSGQSQGTSTGRANHSNYRQFPEIQHPDSKERTEQLRRVERSNNTEHVKLEEAHLSAPSRTKLNSSSVAAKKRLNSEVSNRRKKIAKPKRKLKKKSSAKAVKKVSKSETKVEVRTKIVSSEPTVIRPVMEVTLDDTDEPGSESQGEFSKETDKSIAQDEGKSFPTVSTGEPSQDSDHLQTVYTSVKATIDFIISERKHSSIQIAECRKSALKTCRNFNIEQSQSNTNELYTEVSIPDDKADVESQDLISDNPRRLVIDEGIGPVFERVNNSEQSSESTQDIKETFNINSVSSEKIELLEQFESAILDISDGTDS